MNNLLDFLSAELKHKLSDFRVYNIEIIDDEVHIQSDYDFDESYVEAIEKELIDAGYVFELSF